MYNKLNTGVCKDYMYLMMATIGRNIQCMERHGVFIPGLCQLRNYSVIYLSEFLAANPEVPGPIPGATRFSE
jgi:hypothetical protein